tara:strand:- start:5 stop:160 length:156 start_codon:yes stop_codon:yes gene_type:complete
VIVGRQQQIAVNARAGVVGNSGQIIHAHAEIPRIGSILRRLANKYIAVGIP